MFDFNTAADTPVVITIDGQQYHLPRFLFPRFKAWAAEQRQAHIDEAILGVKDEESRVRYKMYLSSVPVDVAQQVKQLVTAEGMEYVITDCFRAAGVEQSVIDKVLNSAPPAVLDRLVEELTSAASIARDIEESVKEDDDGEHPLDPANGDSGDSPLTGATGSPSSASSIPA